MFNYIKNQLQIAKLYANIIKQKRNPYAEVVELADAPDSKSGDGDIVRVQVPPSAPDQNNTNQDSKPRFVLFFARDFFGIILRLG